MPDDLHDDVHAIPALTHLRLERPSAGVALLTLDNPGMRNAMSDDMTSSWVTAIDALAAYHDAQARRDRLTTAVPVFEGTQP